MITRMDRNIGRLVDALEQRGLTRETLIIFTSDNGATFEFGNQGTSAALDSNRPFRGQKRTALGRGHPGPRARLLARAHSRRSGLAGERPSRGPTAHAGSCRGGKP